MEKNSLLELEIDSLLNQAYDARINNLGNSVDLANRAIQMSEGIHPYLHARALNQLALFYMIKGKSEQALELSKKALDFFEEIKDVKGIADAKYNIASVHYKTDNYHLGLQHMLDCLQLYRQLQDWHNEARVLKSMGTIYEYFGDQTNAVDSYVKCIEAAEKVKDLNQISNAYNPLSGIYLKRDEIELAYSTIQKSITIKEQTKDIRGYAFALYGRGKVFLKMERFDDALKDFNQALSLHGEMGDKLGEAMAMNKLGVTYMTMNKLEEAERTLKEAINLSERQKIQFIQFKSHYNLYHLSLKKGDLQQALESLEKYIQLKEAVISTHTYNVIKSYESIKKIESLEHEARTQKEKAEIIEKKNGELDSFFYRISHDLKGPISSLLGLHNLVQLEIKDPAALHYFEMYQSQIHRINNIVMDLINLTRMNHGAETKSRIDFKTLVEDCIVSYHYAENFKKINFTIRIEDNLSYVAELAIVNTILQNLIENAIKYARTDVKPYVGIFVSQENGKIKIQVEDNGQGIRREDQPKIFNMFFRASDRAQGTGLGLYILKRAVERLHGEIMLQSEVNIGSTFTAILPVMP